MSTSSATITGCILARNEERRIENALRSLQGWTDQIIVIDNESEDATAKIARRYGALVLSAPRARNFDALRNLAIEHAAGDWLFYLDADERVPACLGQTLRRLVHEQGDTFEALSIPFKNYFCGKWIEHSGWWPGYTRPQLLKKGRFRYNERLHSGVEVDGRSLPFPADDPEFAITHYSYDDLHHYLEKLNYYTDGEAENLHADGQSHSWQAQLAHFVQDWQIYYERGRADLDGMHGFVLAFLSASYRFLSRAKLWDLRRQSGELNGSDAVPGSVREMLEFMARVAQEGAMPWLREPYVRRERGLAPREWYAPVWEGDRRLKKKGKSEPSGITGCILARNEERRIENALRSLQGWTDQIIVIDNESEDATAKIARRYGALVLSAPRTRNFDGIRNLAIEHAAGDWLFYLDADERVPPRLGEAIRRLALERGHEFEALCLPFRNHFYGKWMQGRAWCGYCRPQLLKKGAFRYSEHLHVGVKVEGRTLYLPDDDPDLGIFHYAYDDIHHYLDKLNQYTDVEAENLRAGDLGHSWQAQLAHFALDWHVHYDRGGAGQDGMHGFIQAFLCSLYRFVARAKLWDQRRQLGELHGEEPVPSSLREMLEFMAHVVQDGTDPWLTAKFASSPVGEPAVGQARRFPQPFDPSYNQMLDTGRSHASSREALPLPLVWSAPLFDASGFADEARNFVLALIEAGEPVSVAPLPSSNEEIGLPQGMRAQLEERRVAMEVPADLFVSHTLLRLVQPVPHARFNIARTMFETDRLPRGQEAALNAMDRIWVPSEFNRQTFVRSGVDPAKIAVVPEAIDPAPFAARRKPWPVPGAESFKFLSVFDWSLHKGWDVLVEAFAREFGADRNVGLVLKVWSSIGYPLEAIREQVDALLRSRLGLSSSDYPNLHLWQEKLAVQEMPRLYRAVNAFVLPTRGEGWCRPLMEAMATGLPTLATAWSGLTAFHNAEVGYPLKYRIQPVSATGAQEIPIYDGQWWAEPDVTDLRRQMRRVISAPEEARAKGRAAQQAIAARFSRPAVAAILREEIAKCRELLRSRTVVETHSPSPIQAAAQFRSTPASKPMPLRPNANPVVADPSRPVDFQALLGRPVRIRWEGDQSLLSSLAHVNRELCLCLLASIDVELSLQERDTPWHTLSEQADPRFKSLFARRNAALSGPADVTIRHQFPPNWERPDTGKLIVIQPWELSHLPRQDWVEGAGRLADEVWVPSRFVRDIYVRSGVPAEKVRVVPNGVRSEIFHPVGPRYPVPTQKQTRFLFVGGTIPRKGPDLLLEAYRHAFTRRDDVCLVVKDMGSRTFYQGQNMAEAFRRAEADPSLPEIVYLEEDLTEEELASLYRACTCVVLPYRGEGFGLPPLEGMACGLPAIVTSGGATDDYVDDMTALRVPHHRVTCQGQYSGPLALPVDPWELVPDLDALTAALRWVYERPEETRDRGIAARQRVETGWTWARAGALARERLKALVDPALAHSAPPAVLWAEPLAKPGGASKRGTRSIRETTELSLCMIVRDEEARIASCLQSIRPYVDEMVVVDTGSTDRTREIALEHGARVFDFPWTDSFAEARNQSLALARGQWIFWMDADDVISPECGARLRELIRLHPARDAAYQVMVHIPPGPGEHSATIVDHVKLFPNRPDLRFEHRIHEQILPSLRRAGIDVRFSDLYVTHQHYDRSEAGQARKRQRDFRLLELDLKDHPDHPFVLFNLGMTHLYATKEFEAAAQYLRRSLNGSHWRDSIVRKTYALLTTARMCQWEWEQALAANEEGRGHYPEDAELLYQAGQIYQQLERYEEARSALFRLVEGKDDAHYRSVNVGLRTYRGWHELALLFQRMGDSLQCERILRRILDEHPDYVPARMDLEEMLQDAALHPVGREGSPSVAQSKVETPIRSAGSPAGLFRQAGVRDGDGKIRDILRSLHREYISHISTPGMAISLELSFFLWGLLRERQTKRILDLGSGFSSVVFRLYARTGAPDVTVWTVDDDGAWLNTTQQFLQAHALPVDNMCLWERFQEQGFDVILHDLGNYETRAATLENVITRSRPGGLVILDDMHHGPYAAYAVETLRRMGLRLQDLTDVTRDGFGRYSCLAPIP